MSVCSPPPSHSHLQNAVVSNSVPEFGIPLQCPQNPKLHFELTNSLKLVASRHSSFRNRRFYLNCAGSETTFVTGQNDNFTVAEARVSEPRIDGSGGGNDGGDGGDSFGGGGRGGEGEGDGGDKGGEGDEFGPLLKFDEVMKESDARGVKLPQDMVEAAKTTGLREAFLQRYLDLQGSVWPLGFLMKYCSMLRNRMLADPSFLFKVGTEIVIDSCCATFAEVQKRGKDLWAEFELYAADLLGRSVISVDDTLKIIACREQHKKLSALEMELAAARQEGFTSMRSIEINGTDYKRRPLVVIGIFTTFGRKTNRDAIRKAWMGTGATLKKMENEKGIIARGLFGTQCSNWKAISITRIIWKLTTTSFHLHNRGILLLLVFFAAGAGRTMLISDAGKVYAFGKD